MEYDTAAASVQIESALTGETILDCTSLLVPGTFSSNRAGCMFDLWLDLFMAARLLSNPQLLRIAITQLGQSKLYRLSMPEISGNLASIQGVSYAEALSDIEVNLFLDDSTLAGYTSVDDSQVSTARPKMYSISTDATRLFIGLNKGATYDSGTDLGAMMYRVDPLSDTLCYGVMFEYETNLPNGWRVVGQARNDNYTVVSTDINIVATGAAIGPIGGNAYGAICVFFATPCPRVLLGIYSTTGAPYTLPAGIESGEAGFRIIRPRLIGVAHTKINTATTAALGVAGSVTVTVGSTAGMVAGMYLYIDTGNYTQSERVQVTSVLNATQFSTTTTRTHSSGATVRGARLLANNVINEVITRQRIDNPQWLTANQAFVMGPVDDLANRQYYKTTAGAVLADLAGDSLYDYGIDEQGNVYFYPPGTRARAWTIDILPDAMISRQIQDMYNRARVEYTDSSGQRQITGWIDQVGSIAQIGTVRSHTIASGVQSAADAALVRQASLLDTGARQVLASMPFDVLYDDLGNATPRIAAKIGDTVSIRNIDSLLSDITLSQLKITDIIINYDAGTIELVPDQPVRRLDLLLAKINN